MQDLGGNLVAHLNGAGESEATFAIDLGDGAPSEAGRGRRPARLRRRSCAPTASTSTAPSEKPEQKPSLAAITVATDDAGAAQEAHRALGAAAEAVAFTRDLVSEPANMLYPETLAEQAAALAELGVEVEILDENQMRELGMGALLGGRRRAASGRRVVVVMEHRGGRRRQPRRSPLSARASPSIPAASRSSRPPAWAT